MNIRYSKALSNGSFLELLIEGGDSVPIALNEFALVEAAAEAQLQRDLAPDTPTGFPELPVATRTTFVTETADIPYAVAYAASEADAIAAMQDLVKRNGAEGVAKAIDVLKSFGVARVTELADEQRGAFIVKAKAA